MKTDGTLEPRESYKCYLCFQVLVGQKAKTNHMRGVHKLPIGWQRKGKRGVNPGWMSERDSAFKNRQRGIDDS